MNKNVRYVAIAFVIFYLLSQPKEAAHAVRQGIEGLGWAGTQLATFMTSAIP